MITTPTALVLGAGASKPFGYPTGLELLRETVEKLGGGEGIGRLRENPSWRAEELLGWKAEELVAFRDQLSRSALPSVDAFLERRPEFLELGKLTIAWTLIPYEDEGPLFDLSKRAHNWYAYLYQRLNAPLDRFGENRLSVITFNYDRSLEHFLFTALQNSHGIDDGEAAELVDTIPILHVHGVLSALPWQENDGRRYSREVNLPIVKGAAESIVVVSESESPPEVFEQAVGVLEEATHIYFLGFGFHDVNMVRLRIPNIDGYGNKNRYGSAYELGDAEMTHIRNRWSLNLGNRNHDVLSFLKNYFTA